MHVASSILGWSSASKAAFDRAATLHQAGKFAEAELLFREAIEVDPSNVTPRNARGVCLLQWTGIWTPCPAFDTVSAELMALAKI